MVDLNLKMEFIRNGIRYKIRNGNIETKVPEDFDIQEFKKDYTIVMRKVERIKQILQGE